MIRCPRTLVSTANALFVSERDGEREDLVKKKAAFKKQLKPIKDRLEANPLSVYGRESIDALYEGMNLHEQSISCEEVMFFSRLRNSRLHIGKRFRFGQLSVPRSLLYPGALSLILRGLDADHADLYEGMKRFNEAPHRLGHEALYFGGSSRSLHRNGSKTTPILCSDAGIRLLSTRREDVNDPLLGERYAIVKRYI
ncbi:MAG: hypothetical protein KC582_00755 [Candidatus Magasanikbacteria bacterium]|nr:hypothetical protein [Candidatus Magasanikbacteria bacterium]MCA9390770.1 hypothetical protein [Candidatus Magasanikbacteria bacterium]USN52524.1 MAG: hypothetical protein H6759_00360 [Candidatus Nomurabacteria bacterium]